MGYNPPELKANNLVLGSESNVAETSSIETSALFDIDTDYMVVFKNGKIDVTNNHETYEFLNNQNLFF